MKTALIIFVRNPIIGQVKTRIAKDLGNGPTLQVYKQLLKHTEAITNPLDVDVFVFYADFLNENDLWDNDRFIKKLQGGKDLGDKMKNAFQLVFDEGYKRVCVIGSDCYELTTSIIEDAFFELNDHDMVVGPSEDGGYYLLGMKQFLPQVFENKSWSSSHVFLETIQTIEQHHLTYTTLTTLSDVDTIEDCRKYEELLLLTY